MAKRKRRGFSAGTVAMLLLTVVVMIACAAFLYAIVGEDLYEKTETFILSLQQQGLFTQTQEAEPPEPLKTPVVFYMDDWTPVPSAAPAATPTPVPQKVTLEIAAAGTVYAPKAVYKSAQEGRQFDFEPVFAGLGDALLDADLALATLETTTAGEKKGYGNYNTPAAILDALRACGVDVLSLSTERALDYGYDGLDLTVSELTTRGLAYAGVQPGGGSSVTMMRVSGVQIAVLAYTYGLSEEGSAATDGDSHGAVDTINLAQMTADIRQARIDGANLVIVMPHWGTKNKRDVSDNARQTARALAEAGADVILGAHPNVPQETQWLNVTRADGLAYDALVCYSLGSLLTDARTPENTAGMIARLSVTYDPVTRRTTLDGFTCTPTYIARQREGERTVYRIVDAGSDEALKALDEENRQAVADAAAMVREAADCRKGQP